MQRRLGYALVSGASSTSAPFATMHVCQRSAYTSHGNSSPTGRSDRMATMHFGIDPAKLELHLDLDSMNFNKVVTATKEAIAQDRFSSRTHREQEWPQDSAPPERAEETSDSSGTAGKQSSQPTASAAQARESSHRGISDAEHVHKLNTPQAAYEQRRRETTRYRHPGTGQERESPPPRGWSSDARYSLMDRLRDCVMSHNWLRAYKTFESALNKAYGMALTPPTRRVDNDGAHVDLAASGPSTSTASVVSGSEQERETLKILNSINAALPPWTPGVNDPSSNYARKRSLRNMSGLMRWHGGHYILLLRALLQGERLEEVERVWSVMKAIGFLEYQMEERTANSLISLVRHAGASEEAAQHLVAPLMPGKKASEQLSKEKALKRRIVIDLQDIAKKRQLHLHTPNTRTATVARIAEAMSARDGDGNTQHIGHAAELGSTDDAASPLLSVGDFNGLLRLSQSHEGTARVLSMMEQLGIACDAVSYASIVAAHKSAHYRVEGATEAEVLAAARGPQTSGEVPVTDGEHGGSDTAKSVYDAYKSKRIASAKTWFNRCPRDQRTAELYNEMLYLLRASSHNDEFDLLLSDFRGNAVRRKEEWQSLDEANVATAQKVRDDSPAEATRPQTEKKTSGCVELPAILTPAWTVQPNSRTYELLVRRCRYRHDWEGMWELVREMQDSTVRGTSRLYELLMEEARTHPPTAVRKHSDVSAFIMDLYREMRRNHVDVKSVDSTVNLVNAWSATRKHRRLP